MSARKAEQQPSKPLIVTIKASEWARGDVLTWDRLINGDGRKCCLGFDGLACNVDRTLLEMNHYPSEIHDEHASAFVEAWTVSARPDLLKYDDPADIDSPIAPDLGCQAARINDAPGMTDDERIAALRPVFRAAHPPRIIRWLPNR